MKGTSAGRKLKLLPKGITMGDSTESEPKALKIIFHIYDFFFYDFFFYRVIVDVHTPHEKNILINIDEFFG